ncbi:GNAT family N-acetyltransferase [Micromonospora luteifusca]|uniref:GNAT family N-acetyltransferase n=1 Tax=Micromonospora luteifusca TaxID=709860 RepID=UPI0033BE379E
MRRSHQGHGFAGEAAQAVLDEALAAGVARLWATIRPQNIAPAGPHRGRPGHLRHRQPVTDFGRLWITEFVEDRDRLLPASQRVLLGFVTGPVTGQGQSEGVQSQGKFATVTGCAEDRGSPGQGGYRVGLPSEGQIGPSEVMVRHRIDLLGPDLLVQ